MIVPPDIFQDLIQKVAIHVAKSGDAAQGFINTLLANHGSEPRFTFLKPNDPYHPFFQKQIETAKLQLEDPMQAEKLKQQSEQDLKKLNLLDTVISQDQGEDDSTQTDDPSATSWSRTTATFTPTPSLEYSKAPEVPKNGQGEVVPPPDYEYFLRLPDTPPITQLELSILHLTAKFVAFGGPLFWNNLMEQTRQGTTDPHLNFCQKTHSHYALFEKLVTHYKKVLETSRKILPQLENIGKISLNVDGTDGETNQNNHQSDTTSLLPYSSPIWINSTLPPYDTLKRLEINKYSLKKINRKKFTLEECIDKRYHQFGDHILAERELAQQRKYFYDKNIFHRIAWVQSKAEQINSSSSLVEEKATETEDDDDWSSFVIVRTIHYSATELVDLPDAPTSEQLLFMVSVGTRSHLLHPHSSQGASTESTTIITQKPPKLEDLPENIESTSSARIKRPRSPHVDQSSSNPIRKPIGLDQLPTFSENNNS